MEEKAELTIEEHLAALTEIVAELEKNSGSLEESLRKFEEGIAHVRQANVLLADAEKRLKVLTENGEEHDF